VIYNTSIRCGVYNSGIRCRVYNTDIRCVDCTTLKRSASGSNIENAVREWRNCGREATKQGRTGRYPSEVSLLARQQRQDDW
jgi:hypothetical protein